MSLVAWRRYFQSSLRELAHYLWPPSPEELRQLEETALAKELHRRQQRLLRLRQRLERWRGQEEALALQEQPLSLSIQQLTQDGKEQEAYQAAVLLERLRKKRTRLADRRQRGEAVYQKQCDHFQQLKQQRMPQHPS